MQTEATVRVWDDEEGWGVLDSDATPGGCWAHFSNLEGAGYKTLTPGARVVLAFEPVTQDGYDYRALTIRTI